ncbi:hypothetical protein FOXG_22700 [Fusarium oxysporum f. sp. lycopersici 4287]|uniref:Uncharacterized protein n=1 Tax=Fusarium oxysporum f. sp. lycopersici (strain 4287 / CBS 123668 / FGSC 9935 / NRRL 34936) TaxID=426428 RepID=A0A0J9WAR7_FUSO4|nr:hypothetical protein FOXG_22700 [Fusarium oxysporum f. sp. lycopersici 4287]EWZ77717.1 hypothetical protein FOWG_17901 [Fusarium oxysporum f. sp. lycopersici MN25]KAJ9413780.1 hypothetical protein QL093DRAFT_2497326 [Fusarium oxysporum]KNB19963.1 hypothetical protein FOXG_22700 [Fusarium oxysporum f. sp. lycopersici 4287]
MPHSQSTCVAEASSADHVSNPFLLPAFEYEPKPDLQADYPSSVISLREDHPSEFIMPSYIDPFWIHDLSQTVVLSPSATYYSLYTSDQGQTLSLYPGSPEISTFTFFDPDEAISFNLGYSKFDRSDESVAQNDPTPGPKAPVFRPQSHGESGTNSENSFSSASPHGSKRGSDTECQNTRLPKKAMFMHPNSGLDNPKITNSGPALTEDINKRTNVPRTDKWSHTPDRINSTAKDKEDDYCHHALSKLDKKGDATYAIRELSKDRPVNSKAIPRPKRRESKTPDDGYPDKVSARISK